MKRKTKIIGIIVLVVLVIIIALFIFSRMSDSPAAKTVRNILPFGSGDGYVPPPIDRGPGDEVPSDTETPSGSEEIGLFRLATDPVSGFVAFSRSARLSPLPSTGSGQGSTTLSTIIRYTDRATGHIYEVNLTTGEKIKITNTTIPKVYEAHFRSDGSKVLYRTLLDNSDVVENLSLSLSAPSATSSATSTTSVPSDERFYTFTTTLLRGDVGEVAVGSGDTLYLVLKDAPGIMSSNFDGGAQRSLLTSAFTEWRLSRFGSALLAWTKASVRAPGFVYSINPTNGTLTKVLGPFPGLTVEADPSGDALAYSYNDNGEVVLFAKENATTQARPIVPATLAEKCVWDTVERWILYCGVPASGLGNAEPDYWYRGITRYNDNIWSFDTRVDISELLVDPASTVGADLDMYEPQVSPLGDYLVFINKNDLSLWALKLGDL